MKRLVGKIFAARGALLTCALAGSTLACSESGPVEPGGPPKPAFSTAAGALTITLYRDNGESITFDEHNRTLTLSNGGWVGFDESLRDSLVVMFQGILYTDTMELSLSGAVSEYQYNQFPDCKDGGDCATLYAQTSQGKYSGSVGRVSWRPLRLPGYDPRFDAPGRNRATLSLHSDDQGALASMRSTQAILAAAGPLLSFGTLSGNLYSDICTDIANAYLIIDPPWFSKRDNLLQQLITVVTGEVANWGAGRIISPGTAAFATAGSIAHDAAHESLTKSVLGTLWNSYGCGDRQVTAGPYLIGANGTPVSSQNATEYEWQCQWLPWEISFDGGQTWYPIQLWTCIRESDEV